MTKINKIETVFIISSFLIEIKKLFIKTKKSHEQKIY